MAALLFRSSARLCFSMQKASLTTSVCLAVERKYTKKHEWVAVEGNIGTVGITDFAAEKLGDIVYVELPDVGSEFAKGDTIGAVESVKAASDVYSPISGTVTEKNEALEDEPGKINKSTFDEGWMFKLTVKDASELEALLSEKEYQAYKDSEEH